MPSGGRSSSKSTGSFSPKVGDKKTSLPPPTGCVLTCDAPTKMYLMHLDEKNFSISRSSSSKKSKKQQDDSVKADGGSTSAKTWGGGKFILEDLDETHLLVKTGCKDYVKNAVEAWMDESIFSIVDRSGVGENLEMS
uniref:General transcription and DNA repair factor IIH subunit TFB5 n=1 Tax=Corethron hystrix TaxID=216773 RepID=A0A6U5LJ18_9STRA|mmetsp:Transcript_5766/g.12205  ORF Transcript_5766/g.12205 Transcript_5766/m.12205 type:complete len:137 (+) Transcript_5766:85-495(+)